MHFLKLQYLMFHRLGSAPRTLPKMLLNFSQQIAIGMKYLSGKGVVHGKVMASSIMLSSANVCKVRETHLHMVFSTGIPTPLLMYSYT